MEKNFGPQAVVNPRKKEIEEEQRQKKKELHEKDLQTSLALSKGAAKLEKFAQK